MLSLNNRFDVLIEEYEAEKHQVLEALHHFFDNKNLDILWSVAKSHKSQQNNNYNKLPDLDFIRGHITHEKMLNSLDVKHWRKLLDESKTLDYVSAKERIKWQEQLDNGDVPAFSLESIKPTISELMRDLPTLFANRLKEAHDSLSTAHKTNKAQKFDKRMIFTVMFPDNYSWSGGSYSERTVGAINDIRSTISQLLGGEQLNFWETKRLLENISGKGHFGEWVKLDPYIAVRIYKKGTCHLEIHPTVINQLNNILSDGSLPDMSAEWYTKEERKKKTEFHDLAHIVISNELLEAIKNNKPNNHPFWEYIEYGTYETTKVLNYVFNVGVLPEFKSYQFYPTPQTYAQALQSHIPAQGSILEPSAGTGRLVNGLDASRVTCIDIAELHCEILKAKGFNACNMDFMKYSEDNKFDCIIMNPPYSKQRALLHIDKAKKHLNDGGFILAIIPTGKITKEMEVLEHFKGGFDNTSINTSLVRITA